MAVTRTNGGDKDDRRRRERRGRREWRRVCVCVRVRVFACLHVCPIVRALDTRAARLVRPPIPGLPGTRATATAARTESKYGSMATLHVTRRCIYCDCHLNPPKPRQPDIRQHCTTVQREKPNASKEVSQEDVFIAIDT